MDKTAFLKALMSHGVPKRDFDGADGRLEENLKMFTARAFVRSMSGMLLKNVDRTHGL